jgi:hypothetical protein
MVKEEEIDEERLRQSITIALQSIGSANEVTQETIPTAEEFMEVIEGDSFWKNVMNPMTGGARKGRRRVHRKSRSSSTTSTPTPEPSREVGSIQRRVLDFIVSVATPVIGIETGASSCSIIMSFINIASWSAFVYLLISSSIGITIGTEISRFIAGPIHYFISQIPEINEGMENFTMGAVISFVKKLFTQYSVDDIPDIINAIGYIASLVKISGALFEEMVMEPVACAISPVVRSCVERCTGKSPSYYGRGRTRKLRRKQTKTLKRRHQKKKHTRRR